MAYTQEDFQEWIFQIGFKMDYFTREFAEKEGLNLDYSIQSLDDLEALDLSSLRRPPCFDSRPQDVGLFDSLYRRNLSQTPRR